LDAQTSQALVGRLRQERNQARQDALRYNQERNEARAEIVELRAHHSAAAVRSALAPIFPPARGISPRIFTPLCHIGKV
jgi:hypothetical protein